MIPIYKFFKTSKQVVVCLLYNVNTVPKKATKLFYTIFQLSHITVLFYWFVFKQSRKISRIFLISKHIYAHGLPQTGKAEIFPGNRLAKL